MSPDRSSYSRFTRWVKISTFVFVRLNYLLFVCLTALFAVYTTGRFIKFWAGGQIVTLRSVSGGLFLEYGDSVTPAPKQSTPYVRFFVFGANNSDEIAKISNIKGRILVGLSPNMALKWASKLTLLGHKILISIDPEFVPDGESYEDHLLRIMAYVGGKPESLYMMQESLHNDEVAKALKDRIDILAPLIVKKSGCESMQCSLLNPTPELLDDLYKKVELSVKNSNTSWYIATKYNDSISGKIKELVEKSRFGKISKSENKFSERFE